ncbi:NADH-quinone oxidoreductase subunit L [Catalinimonas alkaloidigena]|uniref:NADH-quinone oxidoreductase subunit 5 family protein n=1 Tax=Catalinimonas alkaloidigena TaxID=1075417 RepID=UPI0024056A76|nr:NADH-quinone oxidoreductase subunit L [Catalinimonas alkaloidigena]MDF9799212.1 NADH-quinone oxidoreductase subunit L [Catalinimonas alkaloidigena]
MIATLVLTPFIACIGIYLFKRKADVIALTGALLSLVAAFLLVFRVKGDSRVKVEIAGLPEMPFLLEADQSSATLAVVVAVVVFFIFLYARGYMAAEKGKVWFWAGMSLFVAAMQLLVMAADWILFITGWEIMGFASYLLIGTWHWEKHAQKSANKAFLLTRFTDLGLYIGIFIIIIDQETSQISATPTQGISILGALAVLLAVMGKSAQVPFQSWLSGAMAGPTPVSALLHSATMVAAGAILLLRVYPLLPESSLIWIGFVGGITILLTGMTAIVSRDVKQMLAASTSSQLGFMLLAVGAGFPGAAFAHLLAHAFMKSSLFLGSGIYQHAKDSTSFADIAGLGKKLKISFFAFAIAGIALAGIPPFIGYWSKDGILAAGLQASVTGWYFPVALIGAFFTAIYMGRAIRILWGDAPEHEKNEHFIEKVNWMRAGLLVLVLVVAIGGFWLEPLVKFAEYKIPKNEIAKYSGLAVAIAGLAAGWFLHMHSLFGKSSNFLASHYPLAGGYQSIIVKPVLKLAFWTDRLDQVIHAAVLKAGTSFATISHFTQEIDQFFSNLTNKAGSFSLKLGGLSRKLEESGIELWIASLTSSVQELGKYSKQTQSGRVHKELVWSVGGMLVLMIILIFSMI